MMRRFLKDRSGATAVEYGMIVTCLSLVIIGGIASFGDSMENRFVWLAAFLDSTPDQ